MAAATGLAATTTRPRRLGAGFPRSFPGLSLLYTVNPDPQRPTCVWVNADSGSAQIQNFDAYTGGACGEGPIRVLAASFVVPTQTCLPSNYTSLRVTDPARSQYTSGTVSFQDGDANPVPGLPEMPLDDTGAVNLSGLNLNTQHGLPHPLLMKFTLKLLANLTDPRGGDALDRVINGLTKVVPAA